MIGENFDFFYVMEGVYKIPGLSQKFVVVTNSRNKYVANPDRLLDFVEKMEHVQIVLDTVSGQFFVLLGVNNLEVDQQQVRRFHQPLEFAKVGLGAYKVYARSVDARVDSRRLGEFEKLNEKIHLHQGLAAADGNAALFSPVALVTERLFQKVLGSDVECSVTIALKIPCLGIVAEQTTHGASLRKHYKAYAWSVDRAECFQFIDTTECQDFPVVV